VVDGARSDEHPRPVAESVAPIHVDVDAPTGGTSGSDSRPEGPCSGTKERTSGG
jgi:hypothetical protein